MAGPTSTHKGRKVWAISLEPKWLRSYALTSVDKKQMWNAILKEYSAKREATAECSIFRPVEPLPLIAPKLHIGFASIKIRSRFGVTSIQKRVSLRRRCASTSISVHVHFGFTYISLRNRLRITSASLPLQCGFTSIAHRFHLDSGPMSLRSHFALTSASLRVHFDVFSISL